MKRNIVIVRFEGCPLLRIDCRVRADEDENKEAMRNNI